MNIKILYFILFLVIGNHFISIEGLDIDNIMEDKMNKIKDKVGNNKSNTLSSNSEPVLQDNYDSDIEGVISKKLQDALGKDNNVNITSDEGTFENENIVNKPKIESNNEKAGGMNNIIIIIGFILVVLLLLKK